MNKGWIKVHRSIIDSWFWKEEHIFSKAEAWIDILLNVNHASSKMCIGNTLIDVQAGDMITSIKILAERWQWSRKKVSSFLDLLESDDMIVQKRTSKNTIITVVNWDFYQGVSAHEEHQKNIKRTSEEHQTHIKGTSKEHQRNTNKNDNNIKNDKNDKKKDICAFFETLWELYPNKKGKASISDTQKAKLYAIGLDEMSRAIERYCAENVNTDMQFWKHGSTFFNNGYLDYLDANYQPVKAVANTKEAKSNSGLPPEVQREIDALFKHPEKEEDEADYGF